MIDLDSPAMKVFMGEKLTEDEIKQLNEENIKRSLIKFLYMEKLKSLGVKLRGFSFTPGDEWMDTPTIDIVNTLVDIHNKTEAGDIKSFVFNDSPLVTGREKEEI